MASINFSDGFQLEEKLWANENGFHQPEWRISLKNTFLTDGKQLTGASEKWREKGISIMISTSRKKALKSVSISWNKVGF